MKKPNLTIETDQAPLDVSLMANNQEYFKDKFPGSPSVFPCVFGHEDFEAGKRIAAWVAGHNAAGNRVELGVGQCRDKSGQSFPALTLSAFRKVGYCDEVYIGTMAADGQIHYWG